MALNLNSVAAEVAYTFRIDGESKTWSFNEAMAQKVVDFMNSLENGQTPVAEDVAEKQTAYKPHGVYPSNVSCKWDIDEINVGGKKFYRIVDGIFTAGKWMQSKYNPDEEYRMPTNQEAHRIAMAKVKELEGIKSAEMAGGWKAYGFTSKKAAQTAIETLPDKIQGVEIQSYIEKYGKIQVKAVKRQKTA